MTEYLVRVEAPHFTAGAVFKGNVCQRAAPILSWWRGQTMDAAKGYCTLKGWRLTVVQETRL